MGSPPVSLILSTPFATKSLATRTTSSVLRSSSFAVRSMPSSGMQYRHRRLHFSVRDIRR